MSCSYNAGERRARKTPLFCVAACLLLSFGCGSATQESAGATEQDLYRAVASGDLRFVLLTREERAAEARTADRELMTVRGVEDMDALAAVLSKERIEYFLQENRSARMPE